MSTVAAYQQALRELLAARQRLRAMVETARTVAGAFEGWEKADPRGLNGALDRAVASWPAPGALAAAIADWKDAAERVHAAWAGIPANDRVGLKDPNEAAA